MKKIITLLFFLIEVSVLGQTTDRLNQTVKKISEMVSRQQWTADIPGLAVGVIIDNQVVFKRAYGLQNLQTKKNLTSESDFHMASVSKPFAATAVLQLVELGKLHLDTAIVHYLPYFKMNDTRYKNITLYHILTHSSGIPDVTDYEWHKPQLNDSAAENYTRSFFDKDLDFEPGKQFNYSNAAYNILADVIAKASGVSFEQYVHDHIFRPLGMTSSSFLLNEIPQSRRTAPHTIGHDLKLAVNAVYPYNRIHAPSSTLHSNLNDMLKWAQLFLTKGKMVKQVLIKEDTWHNMTASRLKVNDQFDVCLSWFKLKIAAKDVYFHSGGDTGYRTFVGFEPESKTAVVLMANNDLFDATTPAFAIFKSILANEVVTFKKSISMELRHHILSEGIKKVKQIYFNKMKTEVDRYHFGPDHLVQLASWLYDRGYKQQSIDVLIFCTELAPNVAKWYEHVGDVYKAWGNQQKAILWFKKALVVEPSKKDIEKKIADFNLDKTHQK